MIRFPHLAMGELEQEIMELLWEQHELNAGGVHALLERGHEITVNTVASALKRLHGKKLLSRRKVSHSYLYRTIVTRVDLQRQLMHAISTQFGEEGGGAFLAAFVDLAEERGPETLERLQHLITQKLHDEESS